MTKRPILPKLTRPRPSGVLARERLFEILDSARQCPVTWIFGPAGAGKTTLVASYANHHPVPCMWYQFDAADNDPATLFYYLRECVPARRAALPLFATEYHAGLAEFSRRFFRMFFARCAAGSVLVLDNLEIRGSLSPLAAILNEAAQEVPAGMRMIVTSRDEPPLQFARLELQKQAVRIGWDALRLALSETRAIAEQLRPIDEKALKALHLQCGGWIAGLRLVLEHRPQAGGTDTPHPDGNPEALFRYIASEIFSQLPAQTRDVLLRTSVLPEVGERAAKVLTRDPEAWSLIAQLASRGLLVDTLNGALYRYHSLFKGFLLAQARATLSPFEFKTLQREAGALLAAAGRVEHAVPLLTQAGEWVAASRLILQEASNMMARGHSHTLRQWVNSLPSWYVDATPRLLYCLGVAQSALQPNDAMEALERAHERFRAQGDPLGQALSAAGILQAYYFRLDSYVGMERWAGALDALLQNGLKLPAPATELHVMSMLQIALTYRQPDHPRLPQYAERVLGLITRGVEVNQSVVSASLLLPYLDWFAPDKSPLLASYVRPMLGARDLTPFNHAWWLLAEAHHLFYSNNPEGLKHLVPEIEKRAAQSGLGISPAISIVLAYLSVIAQAKTSPLPEGAPQAIQFVNPSRRQEEINVLINESEIALLRGSHRAAADTARRAVLLCMETGIVPAEMEALGLLAVALSEGEHPAEALTPLHTAMATGQAVGSPKIAFHHHLIEAYIRLKLGEYSAVDALLREGFARAREHGYLKGYQTLPHVMAQLCAQALGAGIEADYVRHIIRSRRLAAPADAGDAWPWPVKIYVLGQFQVKLEDEPLVFSGKAQKKPLDLLRALVCKGFAGASQSFLAQELWPDSEGDAADSALRMTVHRLRKLLVSDDAVQVQEGKLRLNSARCWVDAWAFEEACQVLEAAQGTNGIQLHSPQRRIFDLYKGEAFATESPQAWMLGPRDRWRTRFLRVVRIIGQAEEQRKAWAQASAAYESGISADPLCEEFYQQLITCCIQQGKTAEAFAAYRRCREVLSVTLSVKPSAKTESLRQQIAVQGAA